MSNAYQHISVSHDQDVLVLTVTVPTITEYELAKALETELLRVADNERPSKVAVDMGKIEFMSSVAYMPFIGLRSSVRGEGGRLILCNLSDAVKEMFESTRLLINPKSPKSLFEYAATVEEAIALLQ